MKRKKSFKFFAVIIALLMLFTILPASVFSENGDEADLERMLIPLPLKHLTNDGEFILKETSSIYVLGNTDEESSELYRTGKYLSEKFKRSTGYDLPVVVGAPSGNDYISLTTLGGTSDLGNEGYKLNVTANAIEIISYNPEGAFRGVQTLRQLFPASIEKAEIVKNVKWSAPCSEISDKPEYEYRSTQLDVGRHFFSVEEVKRHIDNISQYKINTLHLHLTEDQGWRLEIKGGRYGEDYSALTEIGASSCAKYILEEDGTCTGKGGFFTQEDFKELVRYASERYVDIVPEVDMPGHTWAALSSLAFLNPDGKKKDGPWQGIDVGFSTFDCRAESTYEFIEDVISQIAEISPSKYFHVGGDEAHVTSKEDYKYFVNRVTEIAKKYNKIPIGWQDYDKHVEDKDTAIGQYWDTVAGNGKNLLSGMKHVVSPANYAYVDMKYPNDDSGLGLQWAAKISTERAYNWDPTNYGDKSQILGVEAAFWTETVRIVDHIDHLVFPRIAGIAEIGWTPKDMRSWDEYLPRLIAHGERLENQGIKFFKDPSIWKEPYYPVNGHWKMNEGQGTSLADQEKLYSGIIKDGVSWGTGKYGTGLDFSGKGWVDLGTRNLEGDWTIGMWVNRGASSLTNATLISGSEGELKLEQWKNTGKVGVTKYGVTDATFNYSAPIGEWVHLTFVGDGTGTSLYVNGEFTDRVTVSILGPAKRLGANSMSGSADQGAMVGSLDELKIFNHALTEEEISTLMEEGIVEDIDTSLLEFMIKEAEQQVEDGALKDVVPKIVERFNNALKTAKDTLAKAEGNPESVTQAEIDKATNDLIEMLHLLDFKSNKTRLERLVATSAQYEKDKVLYRPATYDVFEKALKTAKDVIADENTLQDEIDEAWFDLASGMAGLRKIPNKDFLKKAIEKANSFDKNLYTANSFAILESSVSEGKVVLNISDNVITEEQITNAKKIIDDAVDGLELLATTTTDTTTKGSENTTTEESKNTTTLASGTGKTAPKTGMRSILSLVFTTILIAALTLIAFRKRKQGDIF